MTALTQALQQFTSMQLPRGSAFRMISGGTLWGLVLSGGLLTLSYYSCGVICPGDALVTTGVSVAAGITTIGPVTFLGAKD